MEIRWEMIAEHHYLGGSTKLSKFDYAWCPKWSMILLPSNSETNLLAMLSSLAGRFKKMRLGVMEPSDATIRSGFLRCSCLPSHTSSKPSIYSKYWCISTLWSCSRKSHEREAKHFTTVMKKCAAKTPNTWNDLNQVVQKSNQLKHARCKGINL